MTPQGTPQDTYVAGDGDSVGRLCGRARLADDLQQIRSLSSKIEAGNSVFNGWCLQAGGTWIEGGGDEFLCTVPPEALSTLQAAREQYEKLVGATISIGLGHRASEASKALLAAKNRGKDKVVLYDHTVELEIRALRVEVPEQQKLVEQNFAKAEDLVKDQGSAGSAPQGNMVAPTEGTPDHSAGGQALIDAGMADESASASPEAQFRQLAEASDRADRAKNIHDSGRLNQVKYATGQALTMIQKQLPVLQQLKDAAPDAYAAIISLTQAVVSLGREVAGAEQDVKKALTGATTWHDGLGGFIPGLGHPLRKAYDAAHKSAVSAAYGNGAELPLIKMAMIHNDPKKPMTVYRVQDANGEGPYDSDNPEAAQTKMPLPERSSRDFYQPLPENDFEEPDLEEFYGQGEDGNGAGYYQFAFKHPHHAERWFGRDGIEELYQHGYRVKAIPAQKVYQSASGHQVFFEPHPSYNLDNVPDAPDFDHPTPPPKKQRTKATGALKTRASKRLDKSLDSDRVEFYRAMIKGGDELPPLVVSAVGDLLDGVHRLAAAAAEGVEELAAYEVTVYRDLDKSIGMSIHDDPAMSEFRVGYVEPLEKRSKNVREQTRKIGAKQAFARRTQYARSVGLQPVTDDETVGLPKQSNDNTLRHGRIFPVEHEVAHAMMAPVGANKVKYQEALDDSTGTPQGSHDENVAVQMEYGIDRRAGVGSQRTSLRDFKADDGRRTYDSRYKIPPASAPFRAEPKATTPSSNNLVAKPELIAEAQRHLQHFDNGARFDDQGRVTAPSGIHAAVNSGGGLAALRARAKARLGKEEVVPNNPPPPAGKLDKDEGLPTGTIKDGKVKVEHWDGSKSWRGARAGRILGRDPSHHVVSAREPGSR